ncbi:hypothetical protein GJAV_G00136730 [Gymnothorax javanicus]|nr:hypothetical protein GJAV_G00136730 [Gymnothorax javanicus]
MCFSTLSFDGDERQVAARRIQAYWRSHQDKMIFSLLLRTVRAAENSMASAILCQLSPREALLLRDPSMHFKVRLRFAGPQFPPVVVFKIVDQKGGKYLSGKKLFCSSNQATAETCRIMGRRKFLDMIISDEILSQEGKIVDMMDVQSRRDYMQLNSHLDELPAYLGGRDNGWRTITLKWLWRDFQQYERDGHGSLASRLRNQPLSGTPKGKPLERRVTPRLLRHAAVRSMPLSSSRRSSKACRMATQRKHLHALNKASKEEEEKPKGEQNEISEEGKRKAAMATTQHPRLVTLRKEQSFLSEDDSTDSGWEEEVETLYSWSKKLSLSEMDGLPSDHTDQLLIMTLRDTM